MLSKRNKNLLSILSVLIFSAFAYGLDSSHFPLIEKLSVKDEVFKQYSMDVESNYMNLTAGKDVSNFIFFYKYVPKAGEDFFQLAARFNVGQECLATVNHIASPHDSVAGKLLIVPNCKGVFVSEKAHSTFESILEKKCNELDYYINFEINGEKFRFYPGYSMGGTERSFFLDTSLRMPLRDSVLTSKYGMRISPITGRKNFHNGVDLAAPVGTEVYSCTSGVIEKTGYDEVYGNYVVLRHKDGRCSFYAHLSQILVKKSDVLKSGECLGKVGSTGLSTGPHLHFEIREAGKNIDPFSLVN